MPNNKIRERLLHIFYALLMVSLIFAVMETGLRIKGYRFKALRLPKEESRPFEPDPALGWKNKPGLYTQFDSIRLKRTIWQDGSRATGILQKDKEKYIILLGCSFMAGGPLSDEETLGWKLQTKFPSIQVLNYGTGGYSTYQSYLLLQRILTRQSPPSLVLYGFCDFHEGRNIAQHMVLNRLSRKTKRRGFSILPYCSLDCKGNLIEHAPKAYHKWPLEDMLATMGFCHFLYSTSKEIDNVINKELITYKILLKMDETAKKFKTKFIVLLLKCENRKKIRYLQFFKENNIAVIDCTDIVIREIPVDRHPDSLTNSDWADRVSASIKDEL